MIDFLRIALAAWGVASALVICMACLIVALCLISDRVNERRDRRREAERARLASLDLTAFLRGSR